MKIGISGASGHLGTATLRHLKARLGDGDVLVGISRTPEKVAALGIEARAGNFDHPATLVESFAGLDRLLLIPSSDLRPGVRAKQQTAAIEQAVAAGVGHIALMSALGTRAAEAPHLWQSYFVPEQELMRTAPSWSILRMAYYMESFLEEVKQSFASGVHAATSSTAVNFVARDDVAAAAAGLLATDGHHGAIYQATGPHSLDGASRATVISAVTKTPFSFVQVTAEEYGAGLAAAGLPPFVVDAVLSIQDMWARGGFDVTTGDVALLAGTPPRSLSELAAAALA